MSGAQTQPLRQYQVWVNGSTPGDNYVLATSRGQAKYRYWLDMDCDDLPFTDIRSRVVTGETYQPQSFLDTAKYRNVPWARIGDLVDVGGRRGRIAGANSSANFDVLFEDDGRVLNCHPNWKMSWPHRAPAAEVSQ